MPQCHIGAFRDSAPRLSSKVCAIYGYCYRFAQVVFTPIPLADDDGQEIEVRNPHHQRRATTSWCNSRVASQRPAPAPPVIEAQQARGAGVLRRLSLGGGFAVCNFYYHEVYLLELFFFTALPADQPE